MKIGIWLGDRIVKDIGGGASYVLRLIQMIDQYKFSDGIDICFITFVPQRSLTKDVINISFFPPFLYRSISKSEFLSRILMRMDRTFIQKCGLNRLLSSHGIKIIYYLNQAYCFDPSFPFISTNWDIGHRSTHSFPELIDDGSFERRERFYSNILPKALMIICESETGKKELMDYTKIGAHKIRVMPMFAGGVILFDVTAEESQSMLEKYGLKKNHYFFYPAQFWAHKNHVGVLEAFAKYLNNDGSFKLIFTGSDKGNLKYVKQKSIDLGIEKNVLFLGFIPIKTMTALYKNAHCLIMASHFGPTNMPPIEAMELGCPVICSDLGGHKEILGESGLYFNSYDPDSIYEAMVKITSNREFFVNKITEQRSKTFFNDKFAIRKLDSILQEVVRIRKNWD